MDLGPTLPGTETDPENRIVIHVDLDCFYAACEQRREPELSGEPVIVGMGYEPGTDAGAVATASYEAREYGIESAQPISTAINRLPPASQSSDQPVGYYRPVDMEYYESVAEEIRAILQDCADTLRVVSIDEAYLDVTDRTEWHVADGYARYIRDRIDREVGLTASIGVAPTMHAAKVASDHDKPAGLVVVEPGNVQSFLSQLPIEDLHGVGPVTAQELQELGIETIGDLAELPVTEMENRYGDRGRELHRRARGIDPREVTPRGRPKSLSRESAFGDPTDDFQQITDRINTLGREVAQRARSKEALYQTIGIKVVTLPYEINTRERSLSGPVEDTELLCEIAVDLAAEFENEYVRKVGVRVSNLAFADGNQTQLDDWERHDATDTGSRQGRIDEFN